MNSFGRDLYVWNIYVYSGVSYNYEVYDGTGSFVSNCKDKVVIILNNEFLDKKNKK